MPVPNGSAHTQVPWLGLVVGLQYLAAHANAPTRGNSPDRAPMQPLQWTRASSGRLGTYRPSPDRGPASHVEARPYIAGWASCGRTDHQAQLVLQSHHSTCPTPGTGKWGSIAIGGETRRGEPRKWGASTDRRALPAAGTACGFPSQRRLGRPRTGGWAWSVGRAHSWVPSGRASGHWE